MKMSEKIQAIDEIFLSTSNQEKFLESYGFEALKKVQSKLNSLVENQEEHYKKLAEEEAERLRKSEEEAKALLEEKIEALKAFAKLQLPEDQQNDESAIRKKAEDLLNAMSKPQSVQESKPSKVKAPKSVYKFYTIGGIVERTKSNPDEAFKAALSATGLTSKDQWQLLHEDSIEAFIDDESPKPQVSKKLIQTYREFFENRSVEELLTKLK
ncbi:hypothetical protein AB4264_25425 [Vibrio sp. 10N.261.55.B8]|uniref:hypothetical protein n=1 Tax=unclassified Vibrio TaxID=2614977 RepID=UPI00354DCE45